MLCLSFPTDPIFCASVTPQTPYTIPQFPHRSHALCLSVPPDPIRCPSLSPLTPHLSQWGGPNAAYGAEFLPPSPHSARRQRSPTAPTPKPPPPQLWGRPIVVTGLGFFPPFPVFLGSALFQSPPVELFLLWDFQALRPHPAPRPTAGRTAANDPTDPTDPIVTPTPPRDAAGRAAPPLLGPFLSFTLGSFA